MSKIYAAYFDSKLAPKMQQAVSLLGHINACTLTYFHTKKLIGKFCANITKCFNYYVDSKQIFYKYLFYLL